MFSVWWLFLIIPIVFFAGFMNASLLAIAKYSDKCIKCKMEKEETQ